MEDLFGINARRQAVAENIEKAMTVGFTPDEELEKALGAGYDPNGEDGNVEKAHQVGDIHPNGKWVWTQLPSGKYDWRTIKKNTTEKKQEETGGSKEVDDFMDKVKTFNSKYNDESKIAVVPTDKGNWDTYYDGHRLGIINGSVLSKKTAKDKNWYTEGSGRDHSSGKKEEKKEEKKERYLLKPDGTPIDLSKESDENLNFTRSLVKTNIKELQNKISQLGKSAHVTRGKLNDTLSKQQGMLAELEEEIEKRKKTNKSNG